VIEFWREWLRPAVSNQYVVISFGTGLGILVLAFLIRSGVYIHRFGIINWVKSTFQIEGESWRLIGILLLVMIAAAMVWCQVV
jgi:hypothetical protein